MNKPPVEIPAIYIFGRYGLALPVCSASVKQTAGSGSSGSGSSSSSSSCCRRRRRRCFTSDPGILSNCVSSKVMFALQIGSWRQLPTCNVQLDADLSDGNVLLQYSRNKVNLLVT